MIARLIVTPVKVVRAVGVSRVALLGAGAALGALATPVTGADLRRRIATEVAKRRSGTEESIEDRVRQRLETSPRTWHLPQPEVVAVDGDNEVGWKVILAGSAPDETARVDLAEAARAVTDVSEVDNRIRVETGEEVHD